MIQPIILAAGKGTRLSSESPKAVFPVLGRPMIRWVLDSVTAIPDARSPMVVVGHKADLVKKELGNDINYIEQGKLLGTAAAVRECLPFLSPTDFALIIYVDQPTVTSESISHVANLSRQNPSSLIMGIAFVNDFNDWRDSFRQYGRVVRAKNGSIQKIVEYKEAKDERSIQEVNVGLYCVQVSWLARAIKKVQPSLSNGEYYLTDIVRAASEEGKQIVSTSIPLEEALGVNSKEDAERVETVLRGRSRIPVNA